MVLNLLVTSVMTSMNAHSEQTIAVLMVIAKIHLVHIHVTVILVLKVMVFHVLTLTNASMVVTHVVTTLFVPISLVVLHVNALMGTLYRTGTVLISTSVLSIRVIITPTVSIPMVVTHVPVSWVLVATECHVMMSMNAWKVSTDVRPMPFVTILLAVIIVNVTVVSPVMDSFAQI